MQEHVFLLSVVSAPLPHTVASHVRPQHDVLAVRSHTTLHIALLLLP